VFHFVYTIFEFLLYVFMSRQQYLCFSIVSNGWRGVISTSNFFSIVVALIRLSARRLANSTHKPKHSFSFVKLQL
jgi:hypothetical protein